MSLGRRRIPPIPLESVFDDPRAIALPPAGIGMLTKIIWHFWKTDCAPLPTNADRMFVIAQAQRSTWAAHSAAIMAIVAEAAPKLANRFAAHHARRENLKRLSHKAGSIAKLNQLRNVKPIDIAASTPIVDQAKRATRRPPVSAPDSGAGFVDKLYK